MIVAFFHDERFTRDASGTYHGTGAIPYAALARYLRHFERVIVVARLDEPNPSTRTVTSGEGVEFACIPSSELTPARAIPVMARRVREVLARVDAAVVRMPSKIGLVACREALRLRTPLLVEVVADSFDALWNHGSWQGRMFAVPLSLISRYYIGRAPFSIYVTRGSLQRRYPPHGISVGVSDVVVDPPGTDVLQRRLARIRARAPGAPVKLGLVGSYNVGYKGHETALLALALLRRAGMPVELRCIGAGDPARWRARAAALSIERFVELGCAVPHGSAVLEWMDGLDLYLIPSLQEGLPRALVEAMSRALPAIGSRRGGIPELLEARWLHAPGDDRRLAALVASMLADPNEQIRQARRSFEVASGYSREILDARRDAFVRRFRGSIRESRATGGAERLAS